MPSFFNENLIKVPESNLSSKNSCHILKQPFRKINTGQNALSVIGPALWNIISEEMKRILSNITLKSNTHLPKKICVICLTESTLKVMKNVFYFILKALLVLKIY